MNCLRKPRNKGLFYFGLFQLLHDKKILPDRHYFFLATYIVTTKGGINVIPKLQKIVNQVLKQYEVEVNAKYNIDSNALSLILVTELFKELSGANAEVRNGDSAKRVSKNTPAQRPKEVATTTKPKHEHIPAPLNS
jgi:hypothetical protein